jgi:hypothetical protein
MDNGVIVGQAVAGEAAKTRKQLEQLIHKVNSSAFDIGELLYTIKKNGFYEGYTTFADYTKSLKLKPSKARYLPRIAEVMEEMNVSREKAEAIGISKLRVISSLELHDNWTNPETQEVTPVKEFVSGLIEKGEKMPLQDIHNYVNVIKGKVGAEAMSFLHLYMKTQAIEQVARPAIELAKSMIGSVSKDSEGISQDASDGSAAESIFAAFLADPANAFLAGNLEEEENGSDNGTVQS